MGATWIVVILLVSGQAFARPVALDDFEAASAVVIGRVHDVQRLDPYAYTARLRVERVIEGVAPGPPMRILWEQPLPARPPNFYDDEDVLLAVNALEPVINGDAGLGSDARGFVFEVAAEGAAYVRLPDPQSSYLLSSYLALRRDERFAPIGITAVVRMVAAATFDLRLAALDRLDRISGLDAKLSPDAREMLLLVLSDEDQPLVVRRKILALIGRRKLLSFRDDLVLILRTRPAVEPEVLEGIAKIDGRLPVHLAERALARRRPAVRAVAVRYAPAGWIGDRLAAILRSDPSSEVRAAAARALARRGGAASLRLAMEGLWDVDTVVRSAAARAVGQRGTLAVSILGDVAWSESTMAAEAAVLGLALGGAAGEPILSEIAARHPRPEMRQLAWLAILRF